MLKIAIVEDCIDDAERMKNFLRKYCEEKSVEYTLSTYNNGMDFLTGLKGEYDIVILDIEMPQMDGLHTAQKLRKLGSECNILFVTNMAQYAIHGYKVSASGYMVKPVSYSSFSKEMNRIFHYIAKRDMEDKDIIVKTKQGINIVKASSIIYIESVEHDLIFHTNNKGKIKYYRKSLRDILLELPANLFARCSSSGIVNMKYISCISGDKIVLVDETELYMTRGKRKAFIEQFMRYTR